MKLIMSIFLVLLSSNVVFAEKIATGPSGNNCVEYAKSLVPELKRYSGLWFLDDKKQIINSDKPKKGRVAVINPGNRDKETGKIIGHLAIVISVDDEGKNKSITIQEANFPSPGIYKRKVSGKKIDDVEKELHIIGYFKP